MPVRSRESQTLVLIVLRRRADVGPGSRQAVTADAQTTHSLRTLNRITLPAGHTAVTARQHAGTSRRAREQEPSEMAPNSAANRGGTCRWPGPSVAVRGKPTVRTDRPGAPDAVRYTSVDTATRRLTVTHRDTRRDKKKTAPAARFRSQGAVSAGGGRCWVRTNVGCADGFYSPLSFHPSQTR